MSDRNNGGSHFWRDIAYSIVDIFNKANVYISGSTRAERRAKRQAAAAERALRMPPKGWKPGQPYSFDKPTSSDVSKPEDGPAPHFDPGGPEPVRSESRTSSSSTAGPQHGVGIGRYKVSTAKKTRKPPKRPRNYDPRGKYSGAPAARPPIVLTRRELITRNSLAVMSVLILGLIINIFVLGNLQHSASQQQLTNTFRVQLSEATAPVSEGDYQKVLLADGVPVALIEIPSIGVREIVVEGTSSSVLKAGPGHRRDTILPGQAGVSVIMGRAAAYGGPFSRLQELVPGDQFTVITGQGKSTFDVLGLRYAGDPAPSAPKAGSGRIILETARGPAFVPTGVVRVDAQLTSTVMPAGLRQTTFASLPAADRELATDTRSIWALVFALQFLILIEVALVWAYVRMGLQRTWVVFVPLFLLAGLLVADQVTSLLPNLL
jgi:sortase A